MQRNGSKYSESIMISANGMMQIRIISVYGYTAVREEQPGI